MPDYLGYWFSGNFLWYVYDRETKAERMAGPLLAELAAYMPKYGFSAKPSGQSFRRKRDYGRDSFHINFGKHQDYLNAAADIAIRIDALEDLLNTLDPRRSYLSRKEMQDTASFGGELGALSIGDRITWRIESPDEIPGMAAEIIEKFEAVALPYFERYSDLETMYQTLIRQDREGWKHSPLNDLRCKLAVGLAYLLGKSDELEELIERSDKYLRENDDDELGLEAYRQFAKAVRQKMATVFIG